MKDINESYDPKYLVCVTSDNRNKFYRIIPNSNEQGFTVEYGRIGAPSFRTDHYPIEMYWRKYDEKLKKGYVDQTNLVKMAIASSGEDGFKAIADKSVNELVKALRRYASETIKQNYTIAQNAVTQEMLDSAKELIDKLNSIVDGFGKSTTSSEFNSILIRLFKTIPRKMNKVNDFLLHSDDAKDAAKIVDREQKLYDVLLASFQTQQAAIAKDSNSANGSSQSNGPTETILEKIGLECELVTDQAKIDEIKRKLGQVAPKCKRIFVVANKNTQNKYASFMAAFPNCQTKLFFHGSKNENFWSILKNGLLLNPKATVTGKLLGNGIYFANKAAKSLNYTSLQGAYWAHGTSNIGYLAIFAVAIDSNRYDVSTGFEMPTCHGMTWDKLQKIQPGATYVFAHKGSYLREDEVCIYREDQCTIRYLVELAV